MTPAAVARHVPVLLDEVIDALAITPGETHVDGTYGAGGYSAAMLEAGATVHASYQDPDAIAAGQAMVDSSGGKLHLHHALYSEMADVLVDEDIDGVTLDIGVSSMQLDQAERGFSFQQDGPLDKRMARDGESVRILPLAELAADTIDMLSLIIIGNTTSRAVRRGGNSWAYTPRGYAPARSTETGT